ncbi:MAG: protein translocase subunit SecD [Rhodospirillales bacterium]|nr:protein translocase subunit SecD [Rhodospirillales bacterium]
MMNMARWKVITVLALCALGVIYAAPNLLSREQADSLPTWLPHQQVTLGLDLQGGSHLLLEVDLAAVVRERLTNLQDAARSAMRSQRILISGLSVDVPANTVSFKVREAGQIEQARNAVRELDQSAQVTAIPDGTVSLRLDEREILDYRRRTLSQSIEIVRRRIDETGTREPTIQAQGQDRILVQLPGLRDPERIKELLGKTAKLNFHLLDTTNSVTDARAGRVPPGSLLLPADREVEAGGAPRMYLVQRRVIVAGERLTDAQPGTNAQTGEWIVNFRFDSIGARQFGDATRDNVGRPLAIVLDNKVISAPVIREPILGGSGQISGSFNAAAAQDLSVLLRAGALPAPLNVIEERSVGPDLGADSIEAGKFASVLAIILVIIFMVVAYGLFGLFANIALFFNLSIMLAALSVLGATLTLPGIAGFVLTMGMAVDANVLIYERIREELRNGRTPLSALETGFERAMATIIDSNLTTLIAALLLFLLGSGPVKGFAVVLSIGILTSMFTAILVTRLLVAWWYGRMRPKAIPI